MNAMRTIFPIPIWVFDDWLNQSQIDQILNYQKFLKKGQFQQTEDVEIPIEEIAENNLQEIFNTILIDLDVEVEKLGVTTCWLNYFDKNQNIHVHRHPNSWLSAAYYVAGSSDTSGTIFSDPRPVSSISPTINKFNEINSSQYHTAFKKNRLVVFPSYLIHQTAPNNSMIPRITMSFNIVPVGIIGSKANKDFLRISI